MTLLMRYGPIVALGILIVGCGSSSNGSPAATPRARTPSPMRLSPTTVAASARTPVSAGRPGPTLESTVLVTLVAVDHTPSPSATVLVPAAAAGDPLAADPAIIKSHGYTPDSAHTETPDGYGYTLYVWRATCTGSADGYCQKVFFFIGTRYLGTDTRDPSTQIVGIDAPKAGTIAVSYAHYLAGDAQCCPSGQPVLISYHWNGARLVASGTPPGH